MLVDAAVIDKIVSLSGNSKEGIVDGLGNARKAVYRKVDGSLYEAVKEPPLRRHELREISDVALAWETLVDDKHTGDVFVGDDEILLLLDSDDRRESVVMPLLQSSQYRMLEQMQTSQDWPQDKFVRVLETVLAGCVEQEFVDKCRVVKVRAGGNVMSGATKGGRSMGKDIDEQVEGAEHFPDAVTIRFPLFSNASAQGFTVDIPARFVITPEIKFTLYITDEQFQKATDATLQYLRNQLVSGGIPLERVFLGKGKAAGSKD